MCVMLVVGTKQAAKCISEFISNAKDEPQESEDEDIAVDDDMEEEELVSEEQQHQLIDSDGSYIDASTNQIVMSGDGGLVRLVSMNQGENVVNIVTSTATND